MKGTTPFGDLTFPPQISEFVYLCIRNWNPHCPQTSSKEEAQPDVYTHIHITSLPGITSCIHKWYIESSMTCARLIHYILHRFIPRIIYQHGPSAVFQIPCDHQCLDLKKRSSPEVSNPKECLDDFGRLGNNFVGGKCLKPASQWEKQNIITHYYRLWFKYFGGRTHRTQDIPPIPSLKLISPSVNPVFWGRQTFTFLFLGVTFDLFSGDHTRFHCAQGIGCFRLGSLDGMREYTKRCFLFVGDVVYFLFGFEALGFFCGILWDNIKKPWWPRWFTVLFFWVGGVGEASEGLKMLKKSKSKWRSKSSIWGFPKMVVPPNHPF